MASRPKPATTCIAYRIADARHAIFDGAGAALIGGRWNSPGRPAIYAAASYAGAMLERLVHAGTGQIPKHQKVLLIRIPARVSVEIWTSAKLQRGWNADSSVASRALGDQWLARLGSAVLMVPSAVARYEQNVVINPLHPDFKWIVASPPEPVKWDARLFAQK